VFWVAVVPWLLSVTVLLFGIRENERPGGHSTNQSQIHRRELKRLSGISWWVIIIGFVFTLARFSEAFLVLVLSRLAYQLPGCS
jgi:hypothetical protein